VQFAVTMKRDTSDDKEDKAATYLMGKLKGDNSMSLKGRMP